MLNPFFLQGSATEQGLMQDLINEQLRMYGIDVYYLPRQYITQNTVIKEVISSEFNNAYAIEAYLSNYDGYSENPTILSKFGIQALNEITLVISQERFKNYITPLIRFIPNIRLATRPKEGDLIYFPLGKRLFEIKYVEHEKPFYQLQGNYTYELRCELFRYQDELINTNFTEIDTVVYKDVETGVSPPGGGTDGDGDIPGDVSGNLTNLIMVGIASTATATGFIVNGGVRFITVTNRGGGYTSTPLVGISSAPPGGLTATATAEMIGGIVVCNDNINPQAKSVQRVNIVNAGFGYTVTPSVKFIGGGGSGATAVATIGDGVLQRVSIANSGSGYVTPPTITITGISSISAQATAIVSANGNIQSIVLTNAGLGYTEAPTITIGNPLLMSSGNFVFNEIVTGSETGVTARVKSWNSTTNVLQVAQVSGQFKPGENIVGAASSASHYLKSVQAIASRDNFSQNDEIQEESDKIIDFDESNPFGTV
jgi:hypothetical protein